MSRRLAGNRFKPHRGQVVHRLYRVDNGGGKAGDRSRRRVSRRPQIISRVPFLMKPPGGLRDGVYLQTGVGKGWESGIPSAFHFLRPLKQPLGLPSFSICICLPRRRPQLLRRISGIGNSILLCSGYCLPVYPGLIQAFCHQSRSRCRRRRLLLFYRRVPFLLGAGRRGKRFLQLSLLPDLCLCPSLPFVISGFSRFPLFPLPRLPHCLRSVLRTGPPTGPLFPVSPNILDCHGHVSAPLPPFHRLPVSGCPAGFCRIAPALRRGKHV